MKHGLSGYTNHKCRCLECCQARRAFHQKQVEAFATTSPNDPRHGTTNAYRNFGCRCDKCRAAIKKERKGS